MLRAGFACRKITPILGSFIPGLFERRRAVAVADDLYVRAAVLDDGKTTLALVQTDAIAVPDAVVRAARKSIQRDTGIKPNACLIAATHTHSGGPVCDIFTSPSDAAYLRQLEDEIAQCVANAYALRRRCMPGTSMSHAPGVAFNRRFIMKDGSQVTHPGKMNTAIDHATGPADDTVTAIGFVDAKSRAPLGCIVNFACHATHMNGVAFSADYPRWVIDTLQSVYGPDYGVVFLNGPSGDVTQVDNLSARPLEFGPYWCERTGRAIGGAAVQALSIADYVTSAGLDAASTTFRARIRSASAEEQARARDLVKHAAPESEDVEVSYARELLAVEAIRDKNKTAKVEVQGLRIADALLWTVPGELFQAFALEIRARSPFSMTIGIELANGYLGYICTPDAYTGGGYEIRLARSSLLEGSTGARVVDAATKLAYTLYDRARSELSRLPAKRTWPTVADTALNGINEIERRRRRSAKS